MSILESVLARVVAEITGLVVQSGMLCQTPSAIYLGVALVEEHATEMLLHEFAHWAVATPGERRSYNLGLVGARAEKRELQACALQILLEDAAGVMLQSGPWVDAPRVRLLEVGTRTNRAYRREQNVWQAQAALERLTPREVALIVDALRQGS